MHGIVFCMTARHEQHPDNRPRIKKYLINFSELPEGVELSAELALEFFKNARKRFNVIRGKEFLIVLLGNWYWIDRHGKNFTVTHLDIGDFLNDSNLEAGAEQIGNDAG